MLHGLHQAMAGPAVRTGSQMTLMWEVHVIGEPLQPNPRDRLAVLPVALHLPGFVRFLCQVAVARHTEVQTGNSRDGRLLGGPVAIQTVDRELPGVEGMTEGHRLPVLHGKIGARGRVEQPNHDGEEQAGANDQESEEATRHTFGNANCTPLRMLIAERACVEVPRVLSSLEFPQYALPVAGAFASRRHHAECGHAGMGR